MTENKIDYVVYLDDEPDEEIPDMTDPYWAAKIEAAPVQRGRPKSDAPKVSTTIRLDPDAIAAFQEGGPGWQSRMNAALRKAAGIRTLRSLYGAPLLKNLF